MAGEQYQIGVGMTDNPGVMVIADQLTVAALTKRVARLERAITMMWPLVANANPKTMLALKKIMAPLSPDSEGE